MVLVQQVKIGIKMHVTIIDLLYIKNNKHTAHHYFILYNKMTIENSKLYIKSTNTLHITIPYCITK